jgi:hypothetical protein
VSNLKNQPKPTMHEHPSYGMISLSRSMNSNAGRLFGSSLKSHYATIRLAIAPGQWEHSLHEDRYFAGTSELIEIELSAAQFAEAITSLNVGGGVPCTIRHINFKRIDDPPDIETEVERVKSKFEDDLKDMVIVLKEQRADIEKVTANLPEKARQKLRIALDVMIQQLTSNIPFVMEQFNEASERVVTAAKHEIEAFTMHALHAVGLEAIAEGRMPKQLAASLDVDGKAQP